MHDVVVATGKPNYPDGEIFPGYRAQGIQHEIFDSNIEVFRVPLRARRKKGGLNLLINYLSFVLSGLFYFPWLLRGKKFDAILVFAASPNVAIPALPLKWIKRAHLALWIQDLWPESLSATGYIRSPLILRGVGWVVRFTYACADTILVQSHAFQDAVARYANPKKIFYYPNSLKVEGSPIADSSIPDSLIQKLNAKFSAVFAGNLGLAQGLETLLEAAELLRDTPDIQIVLVGGGSHMEWVENQKRQRNLDHLILTGRFPSQAMPKIFQSAGCLLVNLKGDEIFSRTIPSKVQAYLAAGKPIVAAMNGEGARIIREAEAGLTCPAENSRQLADCIRRLYRMTPAQREQMGEAGKKYFFQHYEMNGQATRLVEILKERLAP